MLHTGVYAYFDNRGLRAKKPKHIREVCLCQIYLYRGSAVYTKTAVKSLEITGDCPVVQGINR